MRSQRFWMPVGMLAASFIGGGLATVGFADKDPAIPEVIEARGFRVVDAEGKVRGGVAMGPDGSVGLAFRDKDGKPRGAFGVLPDGSVALNLYDEDGKVRGAFGVLPNGQVSLGLFDKDGKLRGTFGVALHVEVQAHLTRATETTTESSLVLYDKDGKLIFRAP